jgi:hypothetical protein
MKSYYLDNRYLNAALRNIPFVPASQIYVALYLVTPNAAGVGVEVSGSGYARQLVTFTAPMNGQLKSDNDVVFPLATALWGDIAGFGLVDAASGGNVLYFANLGFPRTVDQSDQVKFPVGALVCQEI